MHEYGDKGLCGRHLGGLQWGQIQTHPASNVKEAVAPSAVSLCNDSPTHTRTHRASAIYQKIKVSLQFLQSALITNIKDQSLPSRLSEHLSPPAATTPLHEQNPQEEAQKEYVDKTRTHKANRSGRPHPICVVRMNKKTKTNICHSRVSLCFSL